MGRSSHKPNPKVVLGLILVVGPLIAYAVRVSVALRNPSFENETGGSIGSTIGGALSIVIGFVLILREGQKSDAPAQDIVQTFVKRAGMYVEYVCCCLIAFVAAAITSGFLPEAMEVTSIQFWSVESASVAAVVTVYLFAFQIKDGLFLHGMRLLSGLFINHVLWAHSFWQLSGDDTLGVFAWLIFNTSEHSAYPNPLGLAVTAFLYWWFHRMLRPRDSDLLD